MSEKKIRVRKGICKICSADGKQKTKGGEKVWEINYTDSNNKPKRKRVQANGIREVEAILVGCREDNTKAELTWSRGLEIFLKAKKEENKTRRYLKQAEKAVASLQEYLGCDKLMEQTQPREIAAYVGSLADRTPRLANYHLSILKAIFQVCKERFLVSGDGLTAVKPLKYKKKEIHPFFSQDFSAHLAALPDYMRPPLLFLLLTGCRIGAACSLKEEDIKEDHLVLYEKGKSGQGKKEKIVWLDEKIQAVLSYARAYKAGKKWTSEWVFLNSKGTPWNTESYANQTTKRWEKAGLVFADGRTHTRHEIRHGLASSLYLENVETVLISKLLGHEHSRTTEKFYIKSSNHQEATLAKQAGKKAAAMFLSGTSVESLLAIEKVG